MEHTLFLASCRQLGLGRAHPWVHAAPSFSKGGITRRVPAGLLASVRVSEGLRNRHTVLHFSTPMKSK